MMNIRSGSLKKLQPHHLFVYLFLLILVIIINYPLIWMFFVSFKRIQEFFIVPIKLFPESFLWSNYATAWRLAPWALYLRNSLVTSIIPMVGQVVLGSMAAFAFTRHFKGSKILFALFLGILMFPDQSTYIPRYVIFRNLRWLNTYAALIVPFLTGAFAIFLIRQFFLSVPKDFEDAAIIDGAGSFYFLFQVLMPLSTPALITVALLTFNDRWNDYLYYLIMASKEAMYTVQVGMAVFQGDGMTDWNMLMAASSFVTIPVIVLFLFVQKRFIDGVMMSGIKG